MFLNVGLKKRTPNHFALDPIRWTGRALFLASIVLAVGCQRSDLADVSGRVTLDGKPLREGLVTFRPAPETAGPEFSGEIADGEYRVVKPVLPGAYVVQVRSWQKTGRTVKSPLGKDTEEIINIIPKRYASSSDELPAVLARGSNSINFDLKN